MTKSTVCRGVCRRNPECGRIRAAKLARKKLDLICANDVSLAEHGFNSDTNALHLFGRMEKNASALSDKALLGQRLIDEIVSRYDEKNRR